MANTYKNIVITPNIGSSTEDPKIQFSGGDASVNTDITLLVYPTSNGTLSFEGSAGQLFSITNDLTGTIFSVNDISGIPSIEVNADGTISLAPFGGNVVIGNTAELIVSAGAGIYANDSLGTAGHTLHSNGSSVYWAVDDQGVTSVATGNGMTGGAITTTGTVSVLANTGIVANATGTFVNATYIGTLTANNTSFVGTVSAANIVSNAQLSANLSNYQTTAGLSANVATLTANNANFVKANNGITSNSLGVFVTQGTGTVVNATGVHVNATYIGTLTANNTSFVGSVSAANVVSNTQLSANLANYQTTAGLASNVATLTANNATNAFGKTEGALNVNSALTSNNSTNLGGVAASGYQTTAGLSANVATLTANNTSFVGTVSAANVVSNAQLSANLANYQTTTGLSANVATLTANNANNLNGQPASFYTNATNITTGTLPYARIPANVINTTAAFTRTGITTFSANIVLGTSGLSSNGGFGTAGHVLHSNGTATYWAVDDQGVTSVASGNGITGGTITSTGTLSAVAGTGTVVNATGIHVNSTYIGTISSNNASFLGGTAAASYQLNSTLAANVAALTSNNSTFSYGKTEGALNVNSASTALTANNATNLGGVAAANYARSDTADTLAGVMTFNANVVMTRSLSANGGFGTAGQVLTSAASGNVYWTAAAGGGYYKGGAATIGTLAAGGSNIFRVNANTLNYNTTIAAGENAQATGPLAVAVGVTLTVQTGARVSIV